MSAAVPPAADRPAIVPLLRLAMDASRGGDRKRAHALFRQVTDLNPANETAWLWLANTADDPAEAVRGLRAVLGLNPDNKAAAAALPSALVRTGAAAARAGDRAAAADLLGEATGRDPDHELGWLWRAGVTEDPRQALAHLEQVLRINPVNEHARQGAAKLRAKLAPAWACPVCDHKAAEPANAVCPKCRCVVSLARPAAFDGPVAGVDRVEAEAAVRRMKVRWAKAPAPAVMYGLGLAYLNLGQTEEGLRVLLAPPPGSAAGAHWRPQAGRLAEYLHARTSAATTTRLARPPADRRVMVVDESPAVRQTVSAVLSRGGFAVVEAADADAAAAGVREGGAPDLFVLGGSTPGTGGFGLCKMFRGHDETARTPVVILADKSGLLGKLHGRWVGASEYLTMPVEPEKLLAVVNRLVPAPAGGAGSALAGTAVMTALA